VRAADDPAAGCLPEHLGEPDHRHRTRGDHVRLAIFDELVPLDAIEEQRTMERRIAARRRLFFGLRQPASDGAATPRRRKAA
jgi:hypothetical protein